MKHIALAASLALAIVALGVATGSNPAAAGMSYECWTYKGGHPDKMTTVVADNNAEAVAKAAAKFAALGITGLPIKCQ